MEYAKKERIGNPDLFIGRKTEMEYFLKWIDEIKKMNSQSSAILARRKMGKTAMMERLFNITFHKNNGVIPFYYEVREEKMWVVDFCREFFLDFIYQYVAFKTRKTEYLQMGRKATYKDAINVVREEKLEYLEDVIQGVSNLADESEGLLWSFVRDIPKSVAEGRDEFIVQFIDEFQFLNSMIYYDKEMTRLKDDTASPYLSTAESKVAPLLVSGSWVGWLRTIIGRMTARFVYEPLPNLSENEAYEMIFKYSQILDIPVTEEVAYLMSSLVEGSPFYISSIMRSRYPGKDLTTINGLLETIEFETLDDQGRIKFTWMEYITGAFPRINDRNTKNIVLYLCKNRDREVTRKEIMDDLKLDMTDSELELKLKALVKNDIILQGQTNFRYRGVKDNIFDKVFRGIYQDEIENFDIKDIKTEYEQSLKGWKRKYKRLQGKYNYQKGYFAEFAIYNQLNIHGLEKNTLLKSITRYLPEDFSFCEYTSVWRYDCSPEYSQRFNIDILARAKDPSDYTIIGEVKCRDAKKFSTDEVLAFETKYIKLKNAEKIERTIGFIFSRCGFTEEAEALCREKGFACSEDERWL